MAQAAKKPIVGNAPPWMLKTKDLTEVRFWVTCTNTTTRTEVTQAAQIEVVEVNDNGLQLRMPARTCAFGHLLILRLERRRSKPLTPPQSASKDGKRKSVWVVEDKIQFTAKVVEVENMPAKTLAVTVQFYQCDQDHWRKFLDELSERQKSVTRLVRRMVE